jgi:cysteinyl-tRNA synthetase
MNLHFYNSLSRKKEKFEPILPGKVGMYVCGPTLYNEPHMGNLRTFIHFDTIVRYLKFIGLHVKYVRNITDAGHITNSLGNEVDSVSIAAKMEQKEPLELVYFYNVKFQRLTRDFNLLPPDIEPTATAHIQEQIEIIEKIIENGFAYEVNGSVYFDVKKYMEKYPYGELSGRKVEDLIEESRELNAQDEKRFFADFALWKAVDADAMQQWRSPWGMGGPGWHIECTAMSTKYLGKEFDIHGGGMDLKFPHHEGEIAQSCGSMGNAPARYWLHSNMLNVNGKKMSKSLGNSFLPNEIIEGTSPLFSKPYSPQVIRFFMMMSHYRSELDASDEALQAAEKGYQRISRAFSKIDSLPIPSNNDTVFAQLEEIATNCYAAMDDDINTSVTIAQLFELTSIINKILANEIQIGERERSKIKEIGFGFLEEALGVKIEAPHQDNSKINDVMQLVLELRKQARDNKDFATSDKIRDTLSKAGIAIKDGKDGSDFEIL